MNKTLFYKELKRSFIGWISVVAISCGYLILILIVNSTMTPMMDSVAEMFGSMPEGFLKALNFSSQSWSNIMGFYATYFVFLVPLITGGFSVVWGINMIAKEEYHRTAEFLLTRPVPRHQVLSTKMVVVSLYILSTNLLIYVTALVGMSIIDAQAVNVGTLTILHFYGLVACFLLMALGLFISMLFKRGRSGVGIGIGIVMGCYLFDMILKVYGKADFLLYLTPFKYINLDVINPGYALEGWRILVPLGVTILLVASSYLLFRRKDIYT